MVMADLRSEFTRPFALILAALAALGWVLFGLSSWSTASVQKTQRLQIITATEKSDKLAAELARQIAVSGELGELEKKVDATRADLVRVGQAKSDLQADFTAAQKTFVTLKRDLSDVDRTVQQQSQKLAELQTSAIEPATAEPERTVSRSYRRGRWSRRGRSSRSYSVMNRSR